MRSWVTLCCLLATSESFAQPLAQAKEPEPYDISWSAPEGCPDGLFARRSLARLLATGKATARQLRADVSVEQAADSAFVLTLRTDLDGTRGERILRGLSCEAVVDAAVLTMALMLNPDIDLGHDAPAKSVSESAPQVGNVSLMPVRRFDLVAPAKSALPLGIQVAAHVGAAAGVLPQLGPEFGLGVSATLGHASLMLDANYGLARDSSLADRPGMGGRLWTGALALIGCWSPRGQRLSVGPCIGNAVTRLQGTGLGVRNPHLGVVYWYAPGAGAHLDLRVQSKLSLRLLGMVYLPVDRPSVFLEDLGELHRPARVVGQGLLGVVVDLR